MDVDALVGELKRLRQGPAIGDGPVKDRVSAVARAAFGISDLDDDAVVRAKMLGRMRTAAESLPDDEAAAISAAFGLVAGYRGRYYKNRIETFAVQRNVNPRTARRWVDRGLEPLARSLLAARAGVDRGTGWWTERLQLSLALDEPYAEALEVRSIVAASDGLTELDLAVTFTDADPTVVLGGVAFRLFYGGTLRVGPMQSSDRIGLVLALPRPLRQGEAHEFALRTRLPAEFAMRRHYVCVPRYPCRRVDLRVRFPADNRPTWIGELRDVYQRDIDDTAVGSEQVAIDDAGEVHLSFTDLTPERATGVRWRY